MFNYPRHYYRVENERKTRLIKGSRVYKTIVSLANTPTSTD